mmetsp:Transcript_13376/g.34287  ORF Transcript_13376/g.34287 Transcript_13376/m.34287 type:complete len:148 (+) Transcript_13376:91-534(+)
MYIFGRYFCRYHRRLLEVVEKEDDPSVGFVMNAHNDWTIFDVYCGLGGFTCGALQAFKPEEMSNLRVIGIDSDKKPLEAFKKNVAAVGVNDVRTICKTVGTDVIEWPEENGRLVVHFSPCCQPFSRARAASPASPTAVSEGINQIKL